MKIGGVEYEQYEHVPGLSLPVAIPAEEYEPPIVVYRNWTDPGAFLENLLGQVGTDFSDQHVVEGRDALVIDIGAKEHPSIYARMEEPLFKANQKLGLDVTYWNAICLNLLHVGGEHAAHSDYMPEAKLFFTLILKDCEEGGEFYFCDTDDEYEAGDLVIFSAFMFHGVNPVLKGERISLTGWMGGPAIR